MGEPAFRETATGLMVPAELSRERQVWTKQEAALLNRVVELLKTKREADGSQMVMMFRCTHANCATTGPITRHRGKAGEMILRCAHLDREFTRAF